MANQQRFTFKFGLLLVSLLFGCGAPTPDPSSANGKQQLWDQVSLALTTEDCATAVDLLQPLYSSGNTDNQTRLLMASAYGCYGKVNYLRVYADLLVSSGGLAGSGFWGFVAKEFTSQSGGKDHVVEGALLGIDALQSALKFGVPILPINEVNVGSFNPGSIFTSDRISESNLYMILMAMSGIGGLQTRYGGSSSGHPVSNPPLPWTTATAVTQDGCGYAASILNFIDATGAAQADVPNAVGNVLNSVQNVFGNLMNAACDLGCKGTVPPAGVEPNLRSNWAAAGTGCNITGGCAKCPVSLRDRNRCTAAVTDVNSCAAAGIVNYINSSGLGWL